MRLTAAVTLLAALCLSAPTASAHRRMPPTRAVPDEFSIHVDGQYAAVATRVTGGDLRATASGVAEVTPLELEVKMPSSGPVVTWMSGFFAGDQTTQKTLTVSPDMGMATEYTGVRLTRVQIIGVDAASKELVTARLSFTATGRTTVKPPALVMTKRTSPMLGGSFRLAVTGVDGFQWTVRVPVFSVTPVAGASVSGRSSPRMMAGAARTAPAVGVVAVELRVAVANRAVAQMAAWTNASLPTTPGTAPAAPTSAVLELLTPNLRDVLVSFRLEGVRLTGLANANTTAELSLTASSVSVTAGAER